MEKLKFSVILMLIVLLPFSMFAEGSQEESETEQQSVLKVLSYTTEPTKTIQEEIFSTYDQEHPNVDVRVDRVPFNELYRKIAVSVASEEPPDVIYVDGPLSKNYAANDIIISLSDYFSNDELSDFLPASIDEGSYQGEIYTIPERQSATAVIYNKKHVEEAGIKPPTQLEDAWTMDEFLNVLNKVTKKDSSGRVSVWGLTQMSKYRVYSDYSFIRSNGQSEDHPTFKGISDDGSTVDGYLDHPNTIEALKFWQDLHQTHKVMPTQQSPSMFENGMSVFYQAAGTAMGKLDKDYPDMDWSVMPQPYFQTPIVHTGSFHWGVTTKSENKEVAVDFIKYITNPENAMKLHQAVQQIPNRISVFEDSEIYKEYPRKVFKDTSLEWGEPRPQTVGFREYEDIMFNVLKDIILGEDVEERATRGVSEIESELEKY
jgi:ABC-type glycerol-3-phosphate transport system substrate-binding protein